MMLVHADRKGVLWVLCVFRWGNDNRGIRKMLVQIRRKRIQIKSNMHAVEPARRWVETEVEVGGGQRQNSEGVELLMK